MELTEQTLRFILPEGLLDIFEVVEIRSDVNGQFDVFLDERYFPPNGEPNSYVSKGFTPATTIQDFPIRGKALFLHIRRRKWYHPITDTYVSNPLNINHSGTRITKEFAAFLKDRNRM